MEHTNIDFRSPYYTALAQHNLVSPYTLQLVHAKVEQLITNGSIVTQDYFSKPGHHSQELWTASRKTELGFRAISLIADTSYNFLYPLDPEQSSILRLIVDSSPNGDGLCTYRYHYLDKNTHLDQMIYAEMRDQNFVRTVSKNLLPSDMDTFAGRISSWLQSDSDALNTPAALED